MLIPAPPATINAPDVQFVEGVISVILTGPAKLVLPPKFASPPTFKFFPIPTPPATTSAPFVTEVELYITNLDLPAEQIWLNYKDRADAGNRIKEQKYDFGIDSFCMDKFWATEAAFRTIMIAYNLMSLFRQVVLQSKTQATLSTLRFKCFALGSWISKHAGQTTLNISAIGEKRKWLDGLFDIVKQKTNHFTFLMHNLGLYQGTADIHICRIS